MKYNMQKCQSGCLSNYINMTYLFFTLIGMLLGYYLCRHSIKELNPNTSSTPTPQTKQLTKTILLS